MKHFAWGSGAKHKNVKFANLQAIQSGSPLDELIMVETDDALVLVEGTKRATPYAPLACRAFESFLGTSPSIGNWIFGRDQ
jgi:hypothetical protein